MPLGNGPAATLGHSWAIHRVLRVARTIADLEQIVTVTSAHVAETLGYRPRGADQQVKQASV